MSWKRASICDLFHNLLKVRLTGHQFVPCLLVLFLASEGQWWSVCINGDIMQGVTHGWLFIIVQTSLHFSQHQATSYTRISSPEAVTSLSARMDMVKVQLNHITAALYFIEIHFELDISVVTGLIRTDIFSSKWEGGKPTHYTLYDLKILDPVLSME